MELGLYTFVDVMSSPHTGETISPVQHLRDLLEEIAMSRYINMCLDMMVCSGILMGADGPVAVTMIKQREYVFLTNVSLIPYTQAKHFAIP